MTISTQWSMLIEYDVKDGFSVCLLQAPFAARQVVVKWLAMQGSTQAAGKGLEHPFDEVMVVAVASSDFMPCYRRKLCEMSVAQIIHK